jgi:RND family efflux transporter MFP subunit
MPSSHRLEGGAYFPDASGRDYNWMHSRDGGRAIVNTTPVRMGRTMRARYRPIVCCCVLLMTGCQEPAAESPVRPIRAIKVGDVSEVTGRTFPGRARATEEVNLSFRVSGPLTEFPMNVGDQVTKAQVLAQIDPRDFEVALEDTGGALDRAEANLEAMKAGARPEELEKLKAGVDRAQAEYNRSLADYQRYAELLESEAIVQAEYDRKRQVAVKAQAELRAAEEELRIGETGAREEDIRAKEAEIRSLKAAVAAAEDRLSYTKLVAPFDGVVASTYVENFETVQEKQQILRVLDISKIEMVIDIPESMISTAQYVTGLDCVFDAFPDTTIEAEVKEIGTEASEITRTYPVTLIMDQPGPATNVKILPGMTGRATGKASLPDGAENEGFDLPESAVFAGDDGQQSVWVIDESSKTVQRKPISLISMTPLGMRVKGIQPGQWVAVAGVDYLTEGQEVRILKESGGNSQ